MRYLTLDDHKRRPKNPRGYIMRHIVRFDNEPYDHTTATGEVYHLTRTWIVLECGHYLLQRDKYYKAMPGDMRHCEECRVEQIHAE